MHARPRPDPRGGASRISWIASDIGGGGEEGLVSVLIVAVPALLVVVLGYVVGHGLWSAFAGDAGAEPAGWITGLVLLVLVTRGMLAWWRWRDRP